MVRFSILMADASEFTQARQMSLGPRRAHLFDPARLAWRFRLLEAVTLPSILAQGDGDWHLLLGYSSELPGAARIRLLDLLAPHPQIVPFAVSPATPFAEALHAVILRFAGDADRPVAVFRLDDDDGLTPAFLDRLREVLARMPEGPYAVIFPKGVPVGPAGNGTLRLVQDFRSFAIACGLTLVAPAGAERGLFNLGRVHGQIDRVVPTSSDASWPAYLPVSHHDNDTGSGSVRHRRLTARPPLAPAAVMRGLGEGVAHVRLGDLAG